jgi:succinyl-CoA synthetase beta subunit
MTSSELLYTDPLEAATRAAEEIASRTGVKRHDIALVMGSGWVGATGDITALTAGTGITITSNTGPIPTVAINTAVTADLTTAQTLTNKTLTSPVVISPEERTTVTATAATGTIAYDAITQGVLYFTSNASANWTLNIRGDSGTTLSSILAVGDAITVTHLVTQGATAYYNSAVQIDGSSVTPKYQGGTAFAAGNASSIDAYVYTVVKTAATPTYTVFASQTRFA